MWGGGHKKGTTSFEVVLTWKLEVLAILKGGAKSFHPLQGGALTIFTLSCGEGVEKVLDPWFSHFVALLPTINDRSLMNKLEVIKNCHHSVGGMLCRHVQRLFALIKLTIPVHQYTGTDQLLVPYL